MKGKEWKDYWEVDQGVSYIPWSKINPDTDFELLEEGGMLDEESFPEWLKRKFCFGILYHVSIVQFNYFCCDLIYVKKCQKLTPVEESFQVYFKMVFCMDLL